MFELTKVTNPMEVQEVIKGLPIYKDLIAGIKEAVSESQEVEVFTKTDLNKASHYIEGFKKLRKKIEKVRDELLEPLKDEKRNIDAKMKETKNFFEGEILEMFSGEDNRLKKEVQDFLTAERKEAERKAAEERKKAEEEAIQKGIEEEERRKKEAAEKGVDVKEIAPVEVPVVAEVLPEEKKLSQMNTSGIQTRRFYKWDYKADFDIVAFVKGLSDEQIRRFISVNEKAVTEERKNHKIDFDGEAPGLKGIRFYFDEKVV